MGPYSRAHRSDSGWPSTSWGDDAVTAAVPWKSDDNSTVKVQVGVQKVHELQKSKQLKAAGSRATTIAVILGALLHRTQVVVIVVICMPI